MSRQRGVVVTGASSGVCGPSCGCVALSAHTALRELFLPQLAASLTQALGTGIGLEIARQFLSVGHKVVLVGRSLERLETAIQSFEDHGDEGATAWALPLAKDVSTVLKFC